MRPNAGEFHTAYKYEAQQGYVAVTPPVVLRSLRSCEACGSVFHQRPTDPMTLAIPARCPNCRGDST